MTETAGNRQKVQPFDWRLPIAPNEKGVIIATKESRVVEWVNDFIQQCMGNQCVLRHAPKNEAFSYLAGNPKIAIALIEISFFCMTMIDYLELLHKQYPKLRIVLFTVSDMPLDEIVRYLYWSGCGFISFRDSPEIIQKRLGAIFLGENEFSEELLQDIVDYERLSLIEPYLTHKEIEVVRCIAQEKTLKQTARFLNISDKTLYNHLRSIRQKFGIRSMVGILKIAVTQGILPEKELRLCPSKLRRINMGEDLVSKIDKVISARAHGPGKKKATAPSPIPQLWRG
jgi:DNA-binding NarL/FixJ family response regulator